MIIKLFKASLIVILFYSYSGCKTTVPITHGPQFAFSDYIFKGEVVEMNKSNLPVVPDSDNTYVVKVNMIILSSSGHENFEGENITVVADNEKLSRLKEGAEYIFYTRTWLFGITLAVIVNNADPDVSKTEELKQELFAYQEREQQVKLQDRLNRAELVFLGEVSEVKEDGINENATISEHNPGWMMATIKVRNMLKGESQDDQINVYFSSSDDMHWFKAPKLTVEQNGIFILSRKDDHIGNDNAFTLTDPKDLLPESELKNVKKLLKN